LSVPALVRRECRSSKFAPPIWKRAWRRKSGSPVS
jgi:hypothetical protein